jgi:hypothetical protein
VENVGISERFCPVVEEWCPERTGVRRQRIVSIMNGPDYPGVSLSLHSAHKEEMFNDVVVSLLRLPSAYVIEHLVGMRMEFWNPVNVNDSMSAWRFFEAIRFLFRDGVVKYSDPAVDGFHFSTKRKPIGINGPFAGVNKNID